MEVTVVCFGLMKDYLGDATAGRRSLRLESPASVGDVADAIGAPRALVHAVLVDGVQASLTSPLHDGAEVTLMPTFTGGT